MYLRFVQRNLCVYFYALDDVFYVYVLNTHLSTDCPQFCVIYAETDIITRSAASYLALTSMPTFFTSRLLFFFIICSF